MGSCGDRNYYSRSRYGIDAAHTNERTNRRTPGRYQARARGGRILSCIGILYYKCILYSVLYFVFCAVRLRAHLYNTQSRTAHLLQTS